jgi:iron complex transport system permease protein
MKKNALILFISSLLLLLLFVLGVTLGSADIPFFESVRALFGASDSESNVTIVRSIRLPRVLGAIFAGAALAVSGLLLQCATGNDLAAPNVIGVNSGAGLFVMIVLALLPGLSALLPLAAFIGATLAALIVLGLSSRSALPTSRASVVLAGVAVGSLFGAGISFLSLLYPDALASYTAFSVGGLSGVYLDDIALPAVLIAAFLFLAFLLTPSLNALALGDDLAASLGARVARTRMLAVLTASALAASAVSYVGLIGFVGLIVPHAARRLAGADNRARMPLCALLGGALVTLADILSRVLFAPTELPCGILISALGAPFFLFLLIVRRERYDA